MSADSSWNGLAVARAIEPDARAYRIPSGSGPKDLPSWCTFAASDSRLVVVVRRSEGWQRAERALAYGLHHAHVTGLGLAVAFADDANGVRAAEATRVRATHLRDGLVSVWTHDDDGHVEQLAPAAWVDVAAVLHEDVLRGQQKPLGHAAAEEALAVLTRAVDAARHLTPLAAIHREVSRSWTYRGLKVLSLAVEQSNVVVRTGVHSGVRIAARGDGYAVVDPAGLTDERARELVAEVRRECDGPAVRKESSQRAEHWFQQLLPDLLPQIMSLDVEAPGRVLREVPTYRPAGGPGLIDLLVLDDDDVLHVVETKLGNDEMLALQGLDYLMWVRANLQLLLSTFQRESFAGVVVDYVVAAKPAVPGRPAPVLRTDVDVMGPYALGSRTAFAEGVEWRVHRADDWSTGDGRLRTVLQSGSSPAATNRS